MDLQPLLEFQLATRGESQSTPVDFIAYTASAMLNATFDLLDGRLSDALNAAERYRLHDVKRTTLESMMVQELGDMKVARQELVAVHATGPRGDPRRRFRGTRHAVSLEVGPYRVQGWVHSAPGAHPTLGLYHRQTMVPLTDAEISYVLLGRPIVLNADAIIVNREAVRAINVQSDGVPDELRVAFPDITFTGSAPAVEDVGEIDPTDALEPESALAPNRLPGVPTGGLFRVGVRTPPYLARPPRR